MAGDVLPSGPGVLRHVGGRVVLMVEDFGPVLASCGRASRAGWGAPALKPDVWTTRREVGTGVI